MLPWMATATLFTLLLGLAAFAVERALRLLGRRARGTWVAALAAAIAWPVIAPVLGPLLPAPADVVAPVATSGVRSTIGALAGTLPPLPTPWFASADTIVAGLWLLTSVVLLVRLIVGWRSLSTVVRSASEVVIGGVPVLITATTGPAVFGVRRPRVLVPRWLLDLDTPQRALAIRHEQEHVQARDPQLVLGVAIAVALMPWNAGVWWIARRLRIAMELDCDARVMRTARDPARYGKLLLFMAERQSHARLTSMLAESKSNLSQRISAMNASRPANAMPRVALLAIVVVGALACSAKYGADLATAPPGGATASAAQATSLPFYSPEGAKPVAPLSGGEALLYPADLRSARVEGEVLASFVVDTSGRVVPGSLRVLRSTDERFVEAVRAAAPNMRFAAAELNGRKVRQLVQQFYFFDVFGSASSRARKPVPIAVPTTDPANRTPMMLPSVIVTIP